jgi:hypothetical protein
MSFFDSSRSARIFRTVALIGACIISGLRVP